MISPRTIPKELSEKYSTSGPRYTSYPTAPQFKTDFDAASIEAKWRASTGDGGLSLYVHVPFCKSRCHYCGCHTTICKNDENTDSYIAAVLREAERIAELTGRGRPVVQLALGGGTPTFLSPEQMASLVVGLKKRFHFPDAGERSIEIHPETVNLDYLSALVEMGFNRFSFGVQDLNPEVQKAIARVQSEDGLRKKLSHLRKLGHSAINIDLIYGLPLQTPETFSETCRKTADIAPSRIAVFGYAHVPWVSPHQKNLEIYPLPETAERMELFGLAYEILTGAGYAHVGMDHFALPDDELITALNSRRLTRNFMGYSTIKATDLAGIGASSISFVAGTFTQNEKDVSKYIADAGGNIWIKGLEQTEEDKLRGEVILELMCNFYLDMPLVESKFRISFADHFERELGELAAMENDGLLKIGEKDITVSETGRFFIRNICMPFDEYLKKDSHAGKYSKTV